MKTETLNFEAANGATTAYVAFPDGPDSGATGKAIILIQEWWGLNGHIKDITERYAAEGFTAIAPDLYRGQIATNSEDAGQMMHALDIGDGIDIIKNAVAKAREAYDIKSFGITGFCMGGTYALRAACELDDFSAAVPFYGDVPEAEVLEKLKTPVLFISGKKDAWINTEKVGHLMSVAADHGLPVESIAYDADHAFFNNTRPEVYDADVSADAWSKALAFFRQHLS